MPHPSSKPVRLSALLICALLLALSGCQRRNTAATDTMPSDTMSPGASQPAFPPASSASDVR